MPGCGNQAVEFTIYGDFPNHVHLKTQATAALLVQLGLGSFDGNATSADAGWMLSAMLALRMQKYTRHLPSLPRFCCMVD